MSIAKNAPYLKVLQALSLYLLSFVLLVILATQLASAQSKWGKNYPSLNPKAKANTLDLKSGFFINKSKKYAHLPAKIATDYGVLTVAEDRAKKHSRTIQLPVIRVKSLNPTPAAPVFMLGGGPGMTNLRRNLPLYLLANHDIVMVGYRGADGSVIMQSPEFGKAITTGKNPLSENNQQNLAKAWDITQEQLKAKGINVNAYNMISVIDDIDIARKKLGYSKINMRSGSYGTRVAYLYGLKYAKRLQYSLMIAVNPPGRFVWEAGVMDDIFADLGRQWKQNPANLKRSPDIIKTIKKVMANLPDTWGNQSLDSDKIRVIIFNMMYKRSAIPQIFEAFVQAEKGNYAGLTFMSKIYNMMLGEGLGMVWGDLFSKAITADYNPQRNYMKEMTMNPNTVIGSPMSQLFGFIKYSKFKFKPIPAKYRKLQTSKVRALLVSGSIDMSTPAIHATNFLKYLPNAQQVILHNRSHQDMGNYQPKVYRKMVTDFFLTGKIDGSGFKKLPIDFKPKVTLTQMSKGH